MIFNRRNILSFAPMVLLPSCSTFLHGANSYGASHARKDNSDWIISKTLIYENALSNENLVKDFRLEGKAIISFFDNKMRLENFEKPELGQASNFVFWCNKVFPQDIEISWEFRPIKEPGLCVAFFNANGQNNIDLFDASLKARTGEYDQYTKSDINALQIAYFRRRWPEERAFHLCNLRQAPGFKLLATSADPIPNVEDITAPFLIKIARFKDTINFSINGLPLISHKLDNANIIPGGGYFGFRQMAPLIGEYANLRVFALN